MNPYKWKYLTPYQRIRYKLKQELKKDKPGFWCRLKIMWYRQLIEQIRFNQFTKNVHNPDLHLKPHQEINNDHLTSFNSDLQSHSAKHRSR